MVQAEYANADESLSLLGLDHPIVDRLLGKYRTLEPEEIGVSIGARDGRAGALGFWAVDWVGEKGQTRRVLLRLAVDATHQRIPAWERQPEDLLFAEPTDEPSQADGMLEASETILERELRHRGLIRDHQTYSGRLVGWVSVG